MVSKLTSPLVPNIEEVSFVLAAKALAPMSKNSPCCHRLAAVCFDITSHTGSAGQCTAQRGIHDHPFLDSIYECSLQLVQQGRFIYRICSKQHLFFLFAAAFLIVVSG